jgi:predicted ester cyclase
MSPNLINPYFRFSVVVLSCFGFFQSSGQDSVLLNYNKKVIARYIDVVINDQNLNRKGEFFHTDYIWHTMNGKDVHSSKDSGHTAILRWLFNAIPDVSYNIDNIEAGGEMVGVSTTAAGIAKSEMFGLPPARKKVYYKQMFFYRLKEGKITDQWEVVDAESIKAQLEQK